MDYGQGENVRDYSYCEADLVRSAKSNVRAFIHIIVGVLLTGLLVWGLVGTVSCIGGCMGCEACIETAACLDSCTMKKGCDDCRTKIEDGCKACEEYYYGDVGCWERMTTENVENAKEGTTCAGGG